jgi:hypothetical protein
MARTGSGGAIEHVSYKKSVQEIPYDGITTFAILSL